MPNVTLGWMDYSIMVLYVGAVPGIGQALRKQMKPSSDIFLSGRSIPAWVTGLAFISANLGALELVGILISIGCAYFAAMYINAMDVIQFVFGFVNAPLFATFLLGMFWKRVTATGAFLGLLLGTATSAAFHALTLAAGNAPGVKGGHLGVVQSFPSELAQNFWLSSFAFLACLALTAGISLATKQTKTDAELTGLVYSLTPKITSAHEPWHMRPGVQTMALLFACLILNIIFF